jgi:subtilase family serine protease
MPVVALKILILLLNIQESPEVIATGELEYREFNGNSMRKTRIPGRAFNSSLIKREHTEIDLKILQRKENQPFRSQLSQAMSFV